MIFEDDSIVTDQDVPESNNAATEESTKHSDPEHQMLKVDVNNSCNDVCFGTSTESSPPPASAKRSSPRISPRLALLRIKKITPKKLVK